MTVQKRKSVAKTIGVLFLALGSWSTINFVVDIQTGNLFKYRYGDIAEAILAILFLVDGYLLMRLKENGRKLLESILWYFIVTGLISIAITPFLAIINPKILLITAWSLLIVLVSSATLSFISNEETKDIFSSTSKA